MNFCKLEILVLVALIFFGVIKCSENDHGYYEGEDHREHYDEDHRSRQQVHSFEQDPHLEDSDYDEDVLTGTSHHEKRDAEKTREDIEELFKLIDKNNDSHIERDELLNHLTVSIKQLHNESTNDDFTRVDTNMDKKVSHDEYSIFEHHDTAAVMDNLTMTENSTEALQLRKTIQHEKDRFKAADSDNDGFLNEQEYLLFKFPSFFAHMAHTVIHEYINDLDVNSNGAIDKKEYIDHFSKIDNKDKVSNEKAVKKAEEDFDKYDKDKNGLIDAKEYMEILKPGYEESARIEADYLFNEGDSNKDGKLTLDEVEEHSHTWLGGEDLGHPEEEPEHGHQFDDEL